MNNTLTLSFCITCKNRLHQIKQTLRRNLDDNLLHRDVIEFVLMDFDSLDGLSGWIVENFCDELDSGYLKFYQTCGLEYWHASVAKNTAHWCASNDIVVNLDCDNFTGFWGGAYVIGIFMQHHMNIVTQQFSGEVGDGSYGRIAASRKYFDLIGGYDESFDPMGYADDDLVNRLVKLGLQHIVLSNPLYNPAISNTKEEGIRYANSSKNYSEMIGDNYRRSGQNLQEGRLIANNGIYGIREGIFDIDGRPFHPKNRHL